MLEQIENLLSQFDLRTTIQLAIVAYLIHKWKRDIKFHYAFLGLMSWHKWDTIGITVFCIFIVHKVFVYYQEQNAMAAGGHSVGGNYPDSGRRRSSILLSSNGTNTNTRSNAIENTNTDTDTDTNTCANTSNSDLPSKKIERKTKSTDNKKRNKKRGDQVESTTSNRTSTITVDQTPPPLTSSKSHPGLSGFHLWMGAMADIYRSYAIGKKNDDIAIPILPRSERGQVQVDLHITNLMKEDIDVYWIDYKGKEMKKGSIRHSGNGAYHVHTYVGHPWAFRRRSDEKLILHFVPYRVVPVTLLDVKALEAENFDTSTGAYRFSIAEPNAMSAYDDICSVVDNIIPHPPTRIQSINHALEFSCQQMEREEALPKVLLKYLHNIALNPNDSKFRQIKTNNKVFWNNIWINGGRGLLHALGFEERGAFIEMGPNSGTLPGERLKQLSNAIVMLEELIHDMEDGSRDQIVKPPGTDGYTGRAGWGT
jgi:hypothetical protein